MDKQSLGFTVNIKYKDHSTKTQSFTMAKGDDAICFYEKDKSDAIIMVEPLKKEFTIDNSSHRFDAISKDDVIIINGIENVGAEYNNDFLVTIDTEKGSKTFKISHSEVSVRKGKTFEPIVKFEEPLDVSLPENLPEQIANKTIKMETFPAQMADMLVKNYNYKSLKLSNGTIILKSPEGKILFSDGTKISTSVETDIVRAPSGLVLRFLPSTEAKKSKENQFKSGANISEKDAKSVLKFIGKNQNLKNIPTLSMDASYKKIRKISPTSRVGKEQSKDEESDEEQSYTVDIPTVSDMSNYYAPDYDQTMGIAISNAISDLEKQDDTTNKDSDIETALKIADETKNLEDLKNDTTNKPTDSDAGDNNPPSPSDSAENTPKKETDTKPDDDKAPKSPTPSQNRATTNNNNNSDSNSNNNNNNNDNNKDKSDTKDKGDTKKNDDKQKSTMDEKAFNAFHKGLRLIFLVLFAYFLLAGIMLANPLFVFIALMCFSVMVYSEFAQKAKFKLSDTFKIFKDVHDYFKAKHAVKELSLSETKKMNKLIRKQSRGLSNRERQEYNELIAMTNRSASQERRLSSLISKQSNSLSRKEQEKLDMLTMRKQFNLSHDEYKKFIKNNDAPSMEKLNEYRNLAQHQENNFRVDKQYVISTLDNEIAHRVHYLEIGRNIFSTQNISQMREDIEKLVKYRETLNNMPNYASESNRHNINALQQSMIDHPSNWLDRELDINQSSFVELAAASQIKRPDLKLSEHEIDNMYVQEQQHYSQGVQESNNPSMVERVEAEPVSPEELHTTPTPTNTEMPRLNHNNGPRRISTLNNNSHPRNLPTTRDSDSPDLTR